mgnify:CR=1 FL=1
MQSIANYWPALLVVGLVALLVYVLIRHGRAIEQAKVEKASMDAMVKILKKKEATDGTIYKLPDKDLDDLI